MGEIGTDENFGDKMGGDRPREHCMCQWYRFLLYICVKGVDFYCIYVLGGINFCCIHVLGVSISVVYMC